VFGFVDMYIGLYTCCTVVELHLARRLFMDYSWRGLEFVCVGLFM